MRETVERRLFRYEGNRILNFRQCFSQHYSDLFRFAFRMLGSRESAEDVTQEAFLRMARDGTSSLEGDGARRWLFVVARNLCLSQLRRGGRETALENSPEPVSTRPGPRETALAQERAHLVREAVSQLPPSLREVVLLREYEDMSYGEIAEVTGNSVGTVRNRLFRARESLRKRLESLLEEV